MICQEIPLRIVPSVAIRIPKEIFPEILQVFLLWIFFRNKWTNLFAMIAQIIIIPFETHPLKLPTFLLFYENFNRFNYFQQFFSIDLFKRSCVRTSKTEWKNIPRISLKFWDFLQLFTKTTLNLEIRRFSFHHNVF